MLFGLIRALKIFSRYNINIIFDTTNKQKIKQI